MKTANETFELLSKLLSEQSLPSTPYNELYEQLFSIIRQDVSIQLNRSTYPYKSMMISELKKVLDGIEILTQFPELVGKTIVGIMGTAGEVHSTLLDKISVQQGWRIYKYGNNVPAIIYNNDKENIINAVNMIESPVGLNIEDFKSANQELHKMKIDIRQFLFAFSISAKIPYSNIAYVLFPFYSLKSREFYDNLFNLVDVVMLPVDEHEKWKTNFEYLRNYKKNIPVKVIASDKNIEDVRTYFQETINNYALAQKDNAVDICIIDNEFDNYLASINFVRNNVSVSEKIMSITSKINVYQAQRMEQLKSIISGMNRDLLNIAAEDTVDSVRKLRIELNESLETEKKNFADFATIIDKLMELVCQFEKSIYQAANISEEEITANDVLYHDPIEEICSKFIMDLIQIGDFNLARKYISKLEARNYPFIYIFELYMDSKMNRKLSYKNIEELKNENEINDMILKAKVKYGNEINLSVEQIAEYAKSIKGSLDSYENYVLGNYYSKIDINQAKFFYRKALEEGCLEAGNKLIQYQEMNNYHEIEKLANMLIPEANYLYGMYCLENNKYARAITYLKIAAVFKHGRAIHKLADIEYVNVIKNRAKSDERTEKSMNIALQLYQYLLHNDPNDIDVKGKLGQVYYWKKDFRKARELLEECDTSDALFLCGRMYQYGDGATQDIHKAKEYFKFALDKGHVRAKVEYEKVCGWISSNSMKNVYDKGRNYSRSSSYSHVSSSGGCFLTTATCLALGKEDDCEEIIEFKRYRDEHLIFDKDGAALIREYYKIAPSIIHEIEKQSKPGDVFQKLFNQYITVGYEYLKKNDYANAKATYIKMVKDLCDRYNISVEANK